MQVYTGLTVTYAAWQEHLVATEATALPINKVIAAEQ